MMAWYWLAIATVALCFTPSACLDPYQPFADSHSNGPEPSVLPTTNYTNEDFPIDLMRSYNCEVCQILGMVAQKTYLDNLKHYSENTYGRKTMALEETLELNNLCSYSNWKPLADATEFYHTHDMTATCKVILSEKSDLLEEMVPAYDTDNNLEFRRRLCEEYDCDTQIWEKEGDHLLDRELKSDRNARMSEQFWKRLKEDQPNLSSSEMGALYKIVSEDKGSRTEAPPTMDDSVYCDYNGTLINGKSFDNSIKRGSPASFGLQRVVPGLADVLSKVRAGTDVIVYIPAELGYGLAGAGNAVGPNMALIFRIKIFRIIRNENLSSISPSDTASIPLGMTKGRGGEL